MRYLALFLILCGVGRGADIAIDTLAELKTAWDTAGDHTIAANTDEGSEGVYTLDANLSGDVSLTITALAPVVIDGGDARSATVVGGAGGTTVEFIGTATNTITFQNLTTFNTTPSSGALTQTYSYVVFTGNTANGFQVTPHASGNCTTTMTVCTSSSNASDGYSIIGVNRDTNVTWTLTNCIALNNNADAGAGVGDQHITTHANTGAGIDTVTITGGSYTGANCQILNIGGNTNMTVTNATMSGKGFGFGAGPANLMLGASNTVTVTATAANAVQTWEANHTGKVFIEGVTLIGGTTATSLSGFRNEYGTGVYKFKNCTIGTQTGGGRGIWNFLTGRIELEDCTLVSTANYAAIEQDSTGTIDCIRCKFPSLSTSAQTQDKILIDDGNLYVRDCEFYDGMNGADQFIRSTANADIINIRNCTFYNVGGGGVFLNLAAGPAFTIEGNIFDTTASNANAITLGVGVTYAGWNNCFWNLNGTGAPLSGAAAIGFADLNETVNPLLSLSNGAYKINNPDVTGAGIGPRQIVTGGGSSRLNGRL